MATSTTEARVEPILTLPPGRPERTLGFGVLRWCSTYIRQPDGPGAGGLWQFTREQVRFILWWYAVDRIGRWLYTRGVYRRAKGAGKSPALAALGLAELCGPVRYGGEDFGDFGPGIGEQLIGVPVTPAWVQLAGVSEKQTVNTMSVVLAMVQESPIVDDYGLDVGITRIYTANGGRLEPITASAPTAEGARPTFIVEDETHHWTDTNGGTKLDRVNRRNLGKSRDGAARMLETTNAHAPGEKSVAEHSYDAFVAQQAGRTRIAGLLYDSRETSGVDLADDDQLMAGLRAAYGDSTWVDLERIRAEILDPSTPPVDSRRFYLNELAAQADSWLSEPEWAACADFSVIVGDRDVITLGFDGSRKRKHSTTDATALIGCHVEAGHLFEIGVWAEPAGPAAAAWQVPTTEIDAAVRTAFGDFEVVGFYADPALWESRIADWEAAFGHQLLIRASHDHPIQWLVNGARATFAVERLHSAILDRELTHGGEWALTRHVLNARRRENRYGTSIAKEHPESALKIDAAMAAALAWQARLDAIAAGPPKRKRGGRVSGLN